MSLTFVTSNANKIDVANKFLTPHNIHFDIEEVEVDEIQSEDFKKISIKKAAYAYSILKRPLFISDHAWTITALNNFPGPFMRYINKWLTADDLLRLMEGKEDREIVLHDSLVFVDERGSKLFTAKHIGVVLKEKQGSALPAQEITSISNDGLSIAKKLETSPSVLDDSPVFDEFVEWIKNNRPKFVS